MDHLEAGESYHSSRGCPEEICGASSIEASYTLPMVDLSDAVYYAFVSGLRCLVLQP